MNECACFGHRIPAAPMTTQAVINAVRARGRVAPGHMTSAEFAALEEAVRRRNATHTTQIRICSHVGRRPDGSAQLFFSLVAEHDHVLDRAGADELRRAFTNSSKE